VGKNIRALLKALSSVAANMSAAWFGFALVTPNFTAISNAGSLFVLTLDVFLGIVFLLITATLERLLLYE